MKNIGSFEARRFLIVGVVAIVSFAIGQSVRAQPPQTFTAIGLTWLDGPSQKPWQIANASCLQMSPNGISGWRLPTSTEVINLVASKSMPGGWASGYIWTADHYGQPLPPGIGSHTIVELSTGAVGYTPDASLLIGALCVHAPIR